MESKDSVRNRLRAAAPEADDRALLYEQLATQREPIVDRAAVALSEPAVVRSGVLDAVLGALVKAGYAIDAAVAQVRAKPLTTLAIAAGVGAILTRLLGARRR